MKFFVFGLTAGACIASALVAPRAARACGGCFVRPTENTVVTDHRMAFSVSPAQTVLWDQIKYSGDPSAFSWVLPVRSGAVVQLSHDEWFAALDATTSPIIVGPTPNCGSRGIGCGGFSSDNSPNAESGESTGVQVISQSVVGPYATVTLRSTDPHALETWLDANGFALPDNIRPTIGAYVSEGFDFIALRLQPGQGIQAMQPVRVVTPGADVTLPLRMVAAGVGAQVAITLFVISEGRYEAQAPFANALVDDSKLVWLHLQNRSNYQETSLALMQNNGGRTWLTEAADHVSLVSTSSGCSSGPGPQSTYLGESLGDAYLGQCQCLAPNACGQAGGGAGGAVGDSSSPFDGQAATDAVADALGAPDGPADATYDAQEDGTDSAAAADATSTASDGATPTDASSLVADASGAVREAGGGEAGLCTVDPCTGFDDLDVALVGMHPGDTWVTRLRAILPVDALGEGDLHVQASDSQSPISRQYNVNSYDDPRYSPCPASGGCSAGAANPGVVERSVLAGVLGFVGMAFLRRRTRRRTS